MDTSIACRRRCIRDFVSAFDRSRLVGDYVTDGRYIFLGMFGKASHSRPVLVSIFLIREPNTCSSLGLVPLLLCQSFIFIFESAKRLQCTANYCAPV